MTGFTKVIETQPKQRWWFDVLDLILYPIMKLFFHNKLTHGWHWKKWKIGEFTGIESISIRLSGDTSLPKITNIWQQIKAEFKGEGQILLELDNRQNPRYQKHWRLGFWNPKTKLAKICNVKIPISFHKIYQTQSGLIRCYIWGDDVVFFGVHPDGLQVPIKVYSSVDAKHYLEVPLL